MKYIRTIGILSFVIFFFTSCEGGTGIYENSETDKGIYFQYEYVNYAWGFQHSGWLIDSSGNVYCFNKPENWHPADLLGLVSGKEMKSNILSSDSICYIIDEEVLKNKIGLISAASRGEISEPVHEMYDAGVGVFSAFMYNPEDKIYEKILLKQLGDYRIDNSSPAAEELYLWLETVNSLVRENR